MVFSILTGGTQPPTPTPIPKTDHEIHSSNPRIQSRTGLNYDDGASPLYHLIEQKEWKNAILRATKTPLEAALWVYRTEKRNKQKLRWKQLPLHAAIVFGGNEVVVHALLRSYPEGVECPDDQGMIPLHLAFRHDAPEAVIDLLLQSYPKGASQRDRKGRIPITLVRMSNATTSTTAAGKGMEKAIENDPFEVKDVEEGRRIDESTSLRTYMANFIYERSNVVLADEKERRMQEQVDIYNDEIRVLQEEKQSSEHHHFEKLLELEEKLVTANEALQQWSQDVKPDKLDFHSKEERLSPTELYDSLVYSIERFAEKAERLEEEKQRGISNGLQTLQEETRQLEIKHQSELDALMELIETDKLETIEMDVLNINKEQQGRLETLKQQLYGRMSEWDQQTVKLEEVRMEKASYAEKVLDLSTHVLEIEKQAQEERATIEEEYSVHQKKTLALEFQLKEAQEEVTSLKHVQADNRSLQLKVDELLLTMNDVRSKSKTQTTLIESESGKNLEELQLAKDALSQASETVMTLEDQMAKLYVEKEGLRSRLYSLQQTSAETEQDQEETIHTLEAEITHAKQIMEMQSERISEWTQKFDGLTAIREREMEMAQGKETLLSAKVEHLTTKYDSFQLEIEEYNERSESHTKELEGYQSEISDLKQLVQQERDQLHHLHEELSRTKESEQAHADRIQELAGNLSKVSMDRKELLHELQMERMTSHEKASQSQSDAMKRVNELQLIMDDTQGTMDALSKRCKSLENENQSLRNSLEEMAKKLVRSTVQHRKGEKSFTKEKTTLTTENKTLQNSISAMKSEIENITSSISTL